MKIHYRCTHTHTENVWITEYDIYDTINATLWAKGSWQVKNVFLNVGIQPFQPTQISVAFTNVFRCDITFFPFRIYSKSRHVGEHNRDWCWNISHKFMRCVIASAIQISIRRSPFLFILFCTPKNIQNWTAVTIKTYAPLFACGKTWKCVNVVRKTDWMEKVKIDACDGEGSVLTSMWFITAVIVVNFN